MDHSQVQAGPVADPTTLGPWPRGLLLVLAGALLLSVWVALRFPLLDPDEGRNAEVAREMALSGDLVIPHLAGTPYLDKPPALFAAAAAAVRLIGPYPLAPRLPAIIAGFATLWLLAYFTRKSADDGQALRGRGICSEAR